MCDTEVGDGGRSGGDKTAMVGSSGVVQGPVEPRELLLAGSRHEGPVRAWRSLYSLWSRRVAVHRSNCRLWTRHYCQ